MKILNRNFLLETGVILILSFMVSMNSASACTIFTIIDQNNIFFGNNEDSTNPNTYIWFQPSNNSEIGVCYLGFDNFIPQGGLNEMGLAFDTNSIPSCPITPRYPQVEQNEWAVLYIMKYCSNVCEVIETIPKLYWGSEMGYQVHFADSTGNAVVVHPGINKELNITRLDSARNYLISTNFNLGSQEGSWPCQRYDTAIQLLSNALTNNHSLDIKQCFDVLNATHAETAFVNTLYSNVFDLKNRIIYLTYWHQYTEIVLLNLTTELSLGNHSYFLKSLFSEEIQEQAQSEYKSYQLAYSESLRSSLSLPAEPFFGLVFLPIGGMSLLLKRKR